MTPAAKERRRWEFHGLNGNSKKSSKRRYRDQQDMPPLKKKYSLKSGIVTMVRKIQRYWACV